MIDLHYWPTPNGKKVTILLEEAGIEYRIVPVNIITGDQFKPDYMAINPNHRMPAMVDHAPKGGGAPLSVFESGAILMYLAEKVGKFWPQDPHGKYAVAQWVMWQMANFGAKIGEFNHFNRLDASAGDQSYALRRYGDEANRLYGVLNWGLYRTPYLGGEEYSIADMAVFPWANNWRMHGQDLDQFKHVKRWLETVGARPAVQRGMDVGKELTIDPATFTPEELERFRKLLFNQRAIPTPDEVKS
jgi:GST-like protein